MWGHNKSPRMHRFAAVEQALAEHAAVRPCHAVVRTLQSGTPPNHRPDALSRDRSENWWSVWGWAADQNSNWKRVISNLHREREANSGEMTEYFAGTVVDMAAKPIPVIDKIEGNTT